MITLEKHFTSGEGGFSTSPRIYEQVKRNERAAIYRRSVKNTGDLEGFEVFRIKIEPKGKRIFKKVLEDDIEHYPSVGEFGKCAWFVMTLERAEEIFQSIITKDNVEKSEPEKADVSIIIPSGEFTVSELAEKNSMDYAKAAIFVKEAVGTGSVKFVREERRAAKGKASKIYIKV